MTDFSIKKFSSNRGRVISVRYTNILGLSVNQSLNFDSFEFDSSAFETALYFLEEAIENSVSDLCVYDSLWKKGVCDDVSNED